MMSTTLNYGTTYPRIIIDRNETNDGRAKSVNQSDSRQYLGDFCSFMAVCPKI